MFGCLRGGFERKRGGPWERPGLGRSRERPSFPLPPPFGSARRSRVTGGLLWGRDARDGECLGGGQGGGGGGGGTRERRAGRWLTSAAVAAAGLLACGRSSTAQFQPKRRLRAPYFTSISRGQYQLSPIPRPSPYTSKQVLRNPLSFRSLSLLI